MSQLIFRIFLFFLLVIYNGTDDALFLLLDENPVYMTYIAGATCSVCSLFYEAIRLLESRYRTKGYSHP